MAAKEGHADVVVLLLEIGADPNVTDEVSTDLFQFFA